MIGQLKPAYIYNLNMYLKNLEQRNIYLKQIKQENKSQELLDIWDDKINEYAEKVYQYRKRYIDLIKLKINPIHSSITDKKELIEIDYISDYVNKQNFKKVLHNSKINDINKGYTTKGIHKDDFLIKINGKPLNIYGSQGQHRTAILSLKISELKIMYEELGEYPILLLDDFMSELDVNRKKGLLNNINNIQVIITCTEKIELDNLSFNSYYVKKGKITKVT